MRRRRKSRGKGRGKAYHYVPQYRLIIRLMEQTGLSEIAVRKQIRDERLWLLQQDYGANEITTADV